MTLTKRDIARAIHAAHPELSIAEAVGVIDAIFGVLKGRLERDEKVMITNFGTFEVVRRAPRQGINPATGARMTIPSHQAVAFRPAPLLQRHVNG